MIRPAKELEDIEYDVRSYIIVHSYMYMHVAMLFDARGAVIHGSYPAVGHRLVYRLQRRSSFSV